VATSDDAEKPGRLARYLYSRKNIVGCTLALGGLVLFFTGVVHGLWPVVVVGLYVFGALVTPAEPSLDLRGDFDSRDVAKELDRLLRRVHGKLPREVQARVDSIVETIDGILPRSGQLAPGSPELFILDRTATDYLPTALENYLNLPRVYATVHPLEGGKTARQLLDGQLDLLSEQMDEVADAVAKNDADRLVAHGRFLEERFGRSDLSLPSPTDGIPPSPGPTNGTPPSPTAPDGDPPATGGPDSPGPSRPAS
jgi:hypothetical protein